MQKKELIGFSLFLYSFSKDMAPRDKVKFIRDFLGYNLSKNGKSYSYGGLLQKLDGIKISNNNFMVPNKNAKVVEEYLQSKGVDFIVKE